MTALGLFVALILGLVPLHSYDLLPLAVLVMIVPAVPPGGAVLLSLGLVVCFAGRQSLLDYRICKSGKQFPESLLLSCALVLIMAIAGDMVAASFALPKAAAGRV